MSLTSKKFFLSRSKMQGFLNDLEKSPDDSAISIYVPPGISIPELKELLAEREIRCFPSELSRMALSLQNGAVVFFGDKRKCVILPPFPLNERATLNSYFVEPLRHMLNTDFVIGLVLVHLGSYAIGICRGERFMSSKVGMGLIHGRHKKGGSSQQRFQRRRENQVREFLDRVCLHAREQLAPEVHAVDYIAYGGPRQTLITLQKRCPFLKSFDDRVLPLMDVPSLRGRVLGAAMSRIWSSQIINWREE